ncbi:hypothetical protein VB773_20160 [Haloarculaceae archaeon H-GB2-1]|nr:hypothetical protein [Haloarculaceae archaeon H-GB2-1]
MGGGEEPLDGRPWRAEEAVEPARLDGQVELVEAFEGRRDALGIEFVVGRADMEVGVVVGDWEGSSSASSKGRMLWVVC